MSHFLGENIGHLIKKATLRRKLKLLGDDGRAKDNFVPNINKIGGPGSNSLRIKKKLAFLVFVAMLTMKC